MPGAPSRRPLVEVTTRRRKAPRPLLVAHRYPAQPGGALDSVELAAPSRRLQEFADAQSRGGKLLLADIGNHLVAGYGFVVGSQVLEDQPYLGLDAVPAELGQNLVRALQRRLPEVARDSLAGRQLERILAGPRREARDVEPLRARRSARSSRRAASSSASVRQPK